MLDPVFWHGCWYVWCFPHLVDVRPFCRPVGNMMAQIPLAGPTARISTTVKQTKTTIITTTATAGWCCIFTFTQNRSLAEVYKCRTISRHKKKDRVHQGVISSFVLFRLEKHYNSLFSADNTRPGKLCSVSEWLHTSKFLSSNLSILNIVAEHNRGCTGDSDENVHTSNKTWNKQTTNKRRVSWHADYVLSGGRRRRGRWKERKREEDAADFQIRHTCSLYRHKWCSCTVVP